MVNAAVLQKANLIIHCIQGIWMVVVMGVVIVSMVQDGPASGAAKYVFAMCWISIPALIYLTQTPRFARTKMFAHPYWVIGINVFWNILWFAAFVALANYNNKGISSGEKNEKDEAKKKQGGCAVFQAGTGEMQKACEMNKTAIGLGAVMWLLWCLTTAIAGYAAWYFSKYSISPFEDLTTPAHHDIEQTTKDAFSSSDEYALINKHERDDDDDHNSAHHTVGSGGGGSSIGVGGGGGGGGSRSSTHGRSDSVTSYDGAYDAHHQGQQNTPYATDAHPGRPVSWGAGGREAYGGIGGHGPAPLGRGIGVGGVAMPETPDDYSYRGASGP